MNALKERAHQRHISFPKPKSEKDTKVENYFYKNLENQIYEQIARN